MQLEFKASNNKKFEIEGIQDNTVSAKKLVKQQLKLYYLIS